MSLNVNFGYSASSDGPAPYKQLLHLLSAQTMRYQWMFHSQMS